MAFKNYTVRLVFDDGVNEYTFPTVFSISDPKEGMKATVIKGTRGDGSIVIPGGKRSQEITIRGKLIDEDGYADLTTRINEMKVKVSTLPATLTLKHWDDTLSGGGDWVTDWTYTVRRIEEITFSESLRTESQEYNIPFFVIAYS